MPKDYKRGVGISAFWLAHCLMFPAFSLGNKARNHLQKGVNDLRLYLLFPKIFGMLSCGAIKIGNSVKGG